ncbi:hypothetical protein J4573_14130 [Actinomadura barringtoniae]|uniref:Uncharacterized protein n=1 Tax=Actinomadura barringtoniae TaxID=1427535 RepID=A0A939T3K4_9ACTN|nr:hypothetical protein [Actinomadura barringtoniae]MBO2448238.1 hypothetical protein [Actinomadura barringtoniae]
MAEREIGREERAHELARAMAAFNRAMNIYQGRTVSAGSRLAAEEMEELRVLGDIIERAAERRVVGEG